MAESAGTWAKVCSYMQKHCAVVLRPDQIYLMTPRLASVAKECAFASVDAFVDRAVASDTHSKLGAALIDAMTTHESYFFRDDSFWQFLENTILPVLLAKGAKGLRIWSAACSTGQEPYSLAMLLEERWPSVAKASTILATDVSAEAVRTASRGLYTTTEVNRGLSMPRLLKHCSQAPGGFVFHEPLRKRITFCQQNLMVPRPQEEPFDLILVRNVLIYFNDADRRQVVKGLLGKLRSGGYFGLGTSERCELVAQVPGWHLKP